MRRSSEAIVVSGNKAFISNWVGGNEIMVINTINDKVVDSIEVGIEPESMVIDKNNMLWVLCNGGWARKNFAELDCNKYCNSMKLKKNLYFRQNRHHHHACRLMELADSLYYLDNGVRKMSISDSAYLPAIHLYAESGHYFYKIGINPVNSDIFVTDAVDYQQKGYMFCIYNNDGTSCFKSNEADIIPGLMCFKLNN